MNCLLIWTQPLKRDNFVVVAAFFSSTQPNNYQMAVTNNFAFFSIYELYAVNQKQ